MTSADAVADHYSRLIRSGSWLDAQDFPPLTWAVPGLVPEGFGLFIGPPKAGKSWAALSIALALSLGGVAFGNVPVGQPRRVRIWLSRTVTGGCRNAVDHSCWMNPSRLDSTSRPRQHPSKPWR